MFAAAHPRQFHTGSPRVSRGAGDISPAFSTLNPASGDLGTTTFVMSPRAIPSEIHQEIRSSGLGRGWMLRASASVHANSKGKAVTHRCGRDPQSPTQSPPSVPHDGSRLSRGDTNRSTPRLRHYDGWRRDLRPYCAW